MDYTLLQNEINNDPTGKGYANHLPHSPGKVVELLNSQTEAMPKSRMITARGVMSSYGIGPVAGAMFLDKLEVLSASVPALKWAMKFLQQESGIDIGEPATQQLLYSLVGIGGITSAEVSGVKSMAKMPASRFEILYGNNKLATEYDLHNAGVV